MTQGAGPTHAVIIPHYNDVVRLTRCLEALEPQLTDAVEVVVADNASSDDLSELAARFDMVRFVTEPSKGAALARNCGVAQTTASGLIFLDCDCVPAPGWLAKACAIDATNAVVGGRMDVFDETPPPRSGAEVFETVFAFDQKDYIARKGFSVTANLVTTRAVFEATGPMITGLSEDMDWCRRAVAAGFSLTYDDELVASHPTRQDWPALRKKWARTTHEMFGLNGTSPSARLKWFLRALAMPMSALAHMPRILTHPNLNSGERVSGVITLFRLRCTRCAWMVAQSLGIKT